MTTSLTAWERQVFEVLGNETNTVDDINKVLAEAPESISGTLYRIVTESLVLTFQVTEERVAESFRTAERFEDDRLLLDYVEWSQNPYTWFYTERSLRDHMLLVDAIMDDEEIQGETGFLMFVWDQILSEIREKFESEPNKDEELFERFAYFVDKIEEYANM